MTKIALPIEWSDNRIRTIQMWCNTPVILSTPKQTGATMEENNGYIGSFTCNSQWYLDIYSFFEFRVSCIKT